MVLVFKDNGIVELRDDDGRQTIRVFHDVKSCDEHWGKALLLLTYQSHNSVELRSSKNGLLKRIFKDKDYIDAGFDGNQICLVDSAYNAEMRNIDDGSLITSESIIAKNEQA